MSAGLLIATILFSLSFIAFVVLGVCFRRKKGLMLIAGYNTLSAKDRDKVDKDLLGKSTGNLMIRMAFYSLLIGVLIIVGVPYLPAVGVVAIVVDAMTTSLRLSKKMPIDAMGNKKGKNSNRSMKISVAVLIVVVVGILVMTAFGEKEPTVTFGDGSMTISGMYGLTINAGEIKSIAIDDAPISVIAKGAVRTNGYGGFGNVMKGHFRSGSLGDFMLFVNSENTPTIRIDRKENTSIFINFKSSEKAAAIFDEMRTHFGLSTDGATLEIAK